MAPQKPSRSLPELNGAVPVIASALANAPRLVPAAGGECGPGPTGFAPELACGKATPPQHRAHATAPGKRGCDQGISSYSTLNSNHQDIKACLAPEVLPLWHQDAVAGAQQPVGRL